MHNDHMISCDRIDKSWAGYLQTDRQGIINCVIHYMIHRDHTFWYQLSWNGSAQDFPPGMTSQAVDTATELWMTILHFTQQPLRATTLLKPMTCAVVVFDSLLSYQQ